MNKPYQHSATQLARLIHDQKMSAVDAVAACFEQIQQQNSTLNAFITLCPEQAEQAAIAADVAIKQDKPIGLQLVGKPHAEAELLRFAYFLQEQFDFRHRWNELE